MSADRPPKGQAWRPDPWRRSYHRLWDGSGWTNQVADARGSESIDPHFRLDEAAPEAQDLVVSDEAMHARTHGHQVLLQGWFQYAGGFTRYWAPIPQGPTNVTITENTTYVDQLVRKKLMSFGGRKPGLHLLFSFPTPDIDEIVIEPYESAQSFRGSGVSVPIGDSGFSVSRLGGRITQQQLSGVSLILHDGQQVLFKVPGPPIEVKTKLAAPIQFLDDRNSRAPIALEREDEPSERYRQLRELAALRDDGILTADEFAREKARLLNDEAT